VQYHNIPEATFETFFTFSDVSDPCVVTGYQVLDETSGPTPSVNPQLDLDGSFGSYTIKIDLN